MGDLHLSLRTYIDCFHASPMPKAYPRGGGYADQDPILMRDFRLIRKMELKCKEENEAKNNQGSSDSEKGGVGGLGNALEEFIRQQEEEDTF